MNRSVTSLEGRLDHRFTQPRLLDEALTHPSVERGGPSASPYERLEFLGDRVLGLVIAGWLYARFPAAREGELARRHAALVNRDALRAVALALNLQDDLRLPRGEDVLDSRANLSVLSDALEAVIGALYLDGGLAVAERFIRRFWEGTLDAPLESTDDPKTTLQEWAQGQGLPLPAYRVVAHAGPAHAPLFRVEVRVQGFEVTEGEGPSKRAAEKAAATAFLTRTGSNA